MVKSRNSTEDGEIAALFDASLFSKEAILKCLYWFGDKFHTTVFIADDGNYAVKLIPLTKLTQDDLEVYLQKLERDLIDFQLRDTITRETQNIRDLLVAKAFSNGEFDQEPPGEISDPVGFSANLEME